jgi:hypothetical protein
MPNCAQECFRVITKWESYTVDGPISLQFKTGDGACPPLTEQEVRG